MISHLLKLVWYRKRSNALIMAEIFFSFLIVVAVATMAISILSRWNSPLGFSWDNVWVMDVEAVLQAERSGTFTAPPDPDPDHRLQKKAAQMQRLVDELKSFPQVEAASVQFMPPYSNRMWGTVLNVNGRRIQVVADKASDELPGVMRLTVLKGRWFNRSDDAQNYLPIVIDARAARAMFGSVGAAVGQKFTDTHFGRDDSPRELRVVGVIAPYRQDGEFSPADTNIAFFRTSERDPWDPVPTQIVMRVRPGTPASFEAELNRRLHPDSADVTFRIRRMEDMRSSAIRMRIAPVIVLGVIATFLVSMVALGLTGVLWQAVTRRMREIGLRRALGASGSSVRHQLLAEVVLLTTMAVAMAAVIVAQLPLLGLTRSVTTTEFVEGFAVALVVIYSIVLLCGAYPSWLASRVDPAEALRYE